MKTLTEKEKNEICQFYKTSTILELANRYKVGDRRIREILKSRGIEIRVPTKKQKKTEWNYNEELRKRYPEIPGHHYEAIEKTTGKAFKDYLNSSGALISYLKSHGIEVPSLHKRTSFFKKNGYQWYEQWFEIVSVENNEKVKYCPYCNWSTIDVDNNSGAFLNHLLKEHGITKEQYLKEHPEDREYLRLANKTLDRQFEEDENEYVTCAICGKKLSRIDWKHLNKHGITKREYIEKYGNNTVSKSLHDFTKKLAHETNINMTNVYTSKAEKEIINFITSKGLACEKNRKLLNGKEIDIYVPEKKIGIEYDGLRWHTEWLGKKPHYFHRDKTDECHKRGVCLMHIFEDEFISKKEIVMNKIAHVLGISGDCERVMGRKCVVKKIENTAANDFLDRFHIQGGACASVSYGAFYGGKMVAAMSFKRKTKNDDSEWELTRFASDYNYICQGVGGKLFSHFLREYNPDKVVSFADRRWTINEEKNVYTCLGFKNIGYVKPSYWYVNSKVERNKRFHKFGFRTDRLIKKYGEKYGFKKGMTETEMAKALGYDRIWDCGLIKYVWKKENPGD